MAAQVNRESDKVIIRLPDGMRDRIKEAADSNGRSMNAEIVATLEEKYPAPGDAGELADFIVEFLRQHKVDLGSFAAKDYARMAADHWHRLRSKECDSG